MQACSRSQFTRSSRMPSRMLLPPPSNRLWNMPDQRTTIVAELGSNHDRSMDSALSLIDAAKAAGADAVKLQDFRGATLASARFPQLRAAFARVELPQGWVAELAGAAPEPGIALLTKAFD